MTMGLRTFVRELLVVVEEVVEKVLVSEVLANELDLPRLGARHRDESTVLRVIFGRDLRMLWTRGTIAIFRFGVLVVLLLGISRTNQRRVMLRRWMMGEMFVAGV